MAKLQVKEYWVFFVTLVKYTHYALEGCLRSSTMHVGYPLHGMPWPRRASAALWVLKYSLLYLHRSIAESDGLSAVSFILRCRCCSDVALRAWDRRRRMTQCCSAVPLLRTRVQNVVGEKERGEFRDHSRVPFSSGERECIGAVGA